MTDHQFRLSMHKKQNHHTTRALIPLLLIFLSLTTTNAIQYKHILNYTYNPSDPLGPPQWSQVDTTSNEFHKFIGKDPIIDLDVPKNECRSRRRPSPVFLSANKDCRDAHEILTRRIRTTDCKFNSLKFFITPHFLRAEFPTSDKKCERPTIDLPNGYTYKWSMAWIEVHLRAEHIVDGRRYDGELTMMHLGQEDQKREVATISVLLDASGDKDDERLQKYIEKWKKRATKVERKCAKKGMVDGRRNAEEDDFSDGDDDDGDDDDDDDDMPGMGDGRRNAEEEDDDVADDVPVRDYDDDKPLFHDDDDGFNAHLRGSNITTSSLISAATTTIFEEEIPRRRMFPYDIWPTIYYYGYKGSFTTPPCAEIVSWRILDEPLVISKKQLKQMAQLLQEYTDPRTCKRSVSSDRGGSGESVLSETGETYRNLQRLNDVEQELKHCTEENFVTWLYPPDKA